MGTTITEALAEIRTISKRVDKKRQGVMQYLARDARVKDPLEKEGGSFEYVKKERQSILDLEKRVVAIRVAIAKSNLATSLSIGSQSMSVFEWLTWRREVSKYQQEFLGALSSGIRGIRDKMQKEGKRVVAAEADADAQKGDAIVHLDEKALLGDIENMEQVLGELDGKLSLLNATTLVEF